MNFPFGGQHGALLSVGNRGITGSQEVDKPADGSVADSATTAKASRTTGALLLYSCFIRSSVSLRRAMYEMRDTTDAWSA